MVLFSNLDRAKKRAQKGCRLNDTNFFSFSADHKSQKGGVGMRLAHHSPFTMEDEERVVEHCSCSTTPPSLIEFKIEKKETKTNSHKNTTFIKIGEGGGSYLRGGVGIISRWARTKMKV